MTAPIPRTQRLARFVPIQVLEQVSAQEREGLSARKDSFPGAVLFADISGFTRLSEQLGQRGAEGVEELTQALNDYFGTLIDIVIASGGDIVKFAGDALMAVWRAEPNDVDVGLKAAAQCGLIAQETLRDHKTQGGETLSLRIGVGVGVIVTASVGGKFDRWEFVVSGKSVAEATNAADRAGLGDVVLGPVSAQRISDLLEGESLEHGYRRVTKLRSEAVLKPRHVPTVQPPLEDKVLGYIPAAIRERLDVGHSNWLGEMRRLTVLFVSLPKLNHETPLPLAQNVMERLQTALYRFEGSVNKLSADDKGITFVAAFGLPPLSHEDDEVRGVRAALEIQASLKQMGHPCSIGVTSGRVFCGIIGNRARCEYTIIGDVVNLSARLMQAAGGGVLCDQATFHAARHHVGFETLPPLTLKGKAAPVEVHRPNTKRNNIQDRSAQPMIGRVAEQQQLAEVQDQLVAGGEGGIVVIDGEPGIGKSRLVSAVREGAAKRNIATLIGAALEMERSTPYFAWRGIFRDLLSLDAAESDAAESMVLRHRFLECFAEAGIDPNLAPLLNPLLPTELEDSEFTAKLTQEARVNMTNDLLKQLLTAEAKRRPCQFILEDCHWMDSASWALLKDVADTADGFLLFLVTRPLDKKPPHEYRRITTEHSVTKISLSPLTENDVESLVCRNLGANDLPRPVADLIREKAQGNPLFGEELGYALRDAGVIRVENGRCLLSSEVDLARLGFPDTVQGVVTSRIDRLQPSEQLTLKVASVVGRAFTCRILQDMFPVVKDRTQQQTQLRALSRRDLISAAEFDEEWDYQFRHVITQEVAYDLIPPTQRRFLHQAIAEWYETHHGDDLSPFYALLAKHWSRTGQAKKALDYLEKSGEMAAKQYANSEVIQFFTQALNLADSNPGLVSRDRKADWNREVAEAYYNLGDRDSSLDHFRAALSELQMPLVGSKLGTAGQTVIELGKQFGLRSVARIARRRMAKCPSQLHEAARCYERLAQIHYLNNARLHTIHAVFKALNLAEAVGSSAVLARCYANAAVVAGLLLMHRKARFYASRANEVAAEVDDPDCTSYVGMILGIYWVTVGEWKIADDLLEPALKIADRIQARRRWAETAFTRVIGFWRSGNLPACSKLAQEGREAGKRDRVPQVELWGLSWLLRCRLIQSTNSEEHRQLAGELDNCLRHSDLSAADQILGHGVLAGAFWRLGEKSRAVEQAEIASRVIAETNQICHYILPAYSGMFDVYSGMLAQTKDRNDRVRFKRLLNAVRKSLREFGLMYPVGRVLYQLHEGQFQNLFGSPRKARRRFRKSIRLAQKFQMPFNEGLAQWELSRLTSEEEQRSKYRKLARDRFVAAQAQNLITLMDNP